VLLTGLLFIPQAILDRDKSTNTSVFLGEKFRMSILNRFRLRAWVLGCLVCGLWQSGATAENLYPTVTALYVGTGPSASVAYTNQSAFNAAVTGQVVQDFSSVNPGFYASPLDVSVSGYSISASAIGGLFVGTPHLFSTNSPGSLTFTFTGTLPTAVGGLFLITDASFNALSSALTVSLNDGTFMSLPAPTGGALNLTGAFAGFTSNVGISSLTVTAGAAVPEIDPNGLSAVLGLIVGGLGLLERRRV
jgi:hypothetical protein